MPRVLHALVVFAGALLAVGCSSSPAPPTTTSAPTQVIDAALITPILATTDLRLGQQRVAFVLEGTTALVTTPELTVTARKAGSTESTAAARFERWPFGTRGSYVTELGFDAIGEWTLAIEGDGIAGVAELPVSVAETSTVADVGQLAPFSNTKTIGSAGGDLSKITSHVRRDADLYQVTVAEALFSGRPSAVVFASPAFCTSPTCGPQVDTLVELKDAHAGEADFIHVEVYDNPDEIQGDLSRAVYAKAVAEWGLSDIPGYRNESWTFVLGRDGRITARFEGYATFNEIEGALLEALAG